MGAARMRGIVYVDILVLVNGVIGAFLLRCTARLCGCRAEGWRFLLGSAAAGLSSLILLLPPLPDAVLWLLKLGSAALIVLAAFPWQGARWYLRALFWYAALNILLSGVVFAALYYGALGNIETNNLTLYFNVSPLTLIVCVTAVYLAMRLCLFAFGKPAGHPTAPFSAWFGRWEVTGTALLDTGFSVRDPVSGEEAFMLSRPAVDRMLPPELAAKLDTYFSSGQLDAPLRLVPTQTAAGMRLLPAVRADRLLLRRQGALRAQACTLAVFTPEQLGGGQFSAVLAAKGIL